MPTRLTDRPNLNARRGILGHAAGDRLVKGRVELARFDMPHAGGQRKLRVGLTFFGNVDEGDGTNPRTLMRVKLNVFLLTTTPMTAARHCVILLFCFKSFKSLFSVKPLKIIFFSNSLTRYRKHIVLP